MLISRNTVVNLSTPLNTADGLLARKTNVTTHFTDHGGMEGCGLWVNIELVDAAAGLNPDRLVLRPDLLRLSCTTLSCN